MSSGITEMGSVFNSASSICMIHATLFTFLKTSICNMWEGCSLSSLTVAWLHGNGYYLYTSYSFVFSSKQHSSFSQTIRLARVKPIEHVAASMCGCVTYTLIRSIISYSRLSNVTSLACTASSITTADNPGPLWVASRYSLVHSLAFCSEATLVEDLHSQCHRLAALSQHLCCEW